MKGHLTPEFEATSKLHTKTGTGILNFLSERRENHSGFGRMPDTVMTGLINDEVLPAHSSTTFQAV